LFLHKARGRRVSIKETNGERTGGSACVCNNKQCLASDTYSCDRILLYQARLPLGDRVHTIFSYPGPAGSSALRRPIR
jgi:hypothetical protein